MHNLALARPCMCRYGLQPTFLHRKRSIAWNTLTLSPIASISFLNLQLCFSTSKIKQSLPSKHSFRPPLPMRLVTTQTAGNWDLASSRCWIRFTLIQLHAIFLYISIYRTPYNCGENSQVFRRKQILKPQSNLVLPIAKQHDLFEETARTEARLKQPIKFVKPWHVTYVRSQVPSTR